MSIFAPVVLEKADYKKALSDIDLSAVMTDKLEIKQLALESMVMFSFVAIAIIILSVWGIHVRRLRKKVVAEKKEFLYPTKPREVDVYRVSKARSSFDNHIYPFAFVLLAFYLFAIATLTFDGSMVLNNYFNPEYVLLKDVLETTMEGS